MRLNEVKSALKELGLRANTMSFYVDENGEENSDTSFGVCELSGIQGNLVGCTVLDEDGNIVFIEIGEWLVCGHVGKLAGAF